MKRLTVIALILVPCLSGCKDRGAIRAFTAALRPELEKRTELVGAVKAGDDDVSLLDGELTLSVSIPDDKTAASLLHIHVLAKIAHRASGPLDFCIFGTDSADAASIFMQEALPPLVSAVLNRPVLGAVRAWGTSRMGVPGRPAFIGLYLLRGDLDSSEVKDSGLFQEASGIPADGRMHLLKAVWTAMEGKWRRSLELDGPTSLENERVMLPAPPGFGMIVAFAVLDDAKDPLNDESARSEALKLLSARPEWLPDPTSCPADQLPASFTTTQFDEDNARGGRLLAAARECGTGAGEQCYAAAQEILHGSKTSTLAQALFVRACSLGNASACTNAAAGRAQQDECAFRSFEAACDRAEDAWGCAMLGMHLLRGKKPDLARARTVLGRSCKYGATDPACAAAKEMLEAIPK